MNQSRNSILDGENLTLENLVLAARNSKYQVELSSSAKHRIKKSRQWVEQVQKTGKPVVYRNPEL